MNEVAAPEVVRPQRVGFAFAKRHGVLVRHVHEGIADCVIRKDAGPLALAEVRRYLGVPIRLEKVEENTFDSLLRQAYEAGNDAMRRPRASKNPPTSRISPRICPSRPTCSRAKTMRRSSGSSTPC